MIHTYGKKVHDTGDGKISNHDQTQVLLAFYLVKKRKRYRRSTTKGRKNTRNYLEEKRRETKTVFKPDIQDAEQINIRDSAQRTSWLAMEKSNPGRSRRRRRTKRRKERGSARKAAGAFNPKTGLEIPNLKPGPRTSRIGTEPPILRRRL